VLDDSAVPFYKWYSDGEINMCYNALDIHIEQGKGHNTAFIYESSYTNTSEKITYQDLFDQVGKIAAALQSKFQIQKGDRVIIYLPNIPASAYFMLACARLGAIHSVVFGGFAAKELANRIDNCKPKLIITASCGFEANKVVKYVPIVKEALRLCKAIDNAESTIKRIVVQRKGYEDKQLDTSLYYSYDELLTSNERIPECVPLEAAHPLYILCKLFSSR
jgi:propionyl-CoA synthetase